LRRARNNTRSTPGFVANSRADWERAGALPGHTREADGSFHDAVMFCRRL